MQTYPNATLRILRTRSELDDLRPVWRELWRVDQNASPFQSAEWLIPWWHHFGHSELRTVLIQQDGDVLAILPFYLYRDPNSGERQLLLLGAGTSDYLDGVFSPRCTPELICSALRRLRRETNWDVAHFMQLRDQSPLLRAMREKSCEAVTFAEGENCWRRAATQQPELPPKIRHDLRPMRKFRAEGGSVEYVRADHTNWREFFSALQSLHAERWRRMGEAGVIADPTVVAWHSEALPQLQAAGLLRLDALHLQGRFVAVLYSLMDPAWRNNRTQYLYLTGHTTELARMSPGTALLAASMEQATEEGVTTMDLLRGDESYKRYWKAERYATTAVTWRTKPCEHAFVSQAELRHW